MDENTLELGLSGLTQPLMGMEISPDINDFKDSGVPMSSSKAILTNRSFVEILMQPKLPKNDSINKEKRCLALLRSMLNPTLSGDEDTRVVLKLRKFINKFNTKWKAVNRRRQYFETKEKDWLDLKFKTPDEWLPHKILGKRPVGRPELSWEQSSSRSKYRKVQKLVEEIREEPLEKLLKTTYALAKNEGEEEVSLFLKQVLSSLESRMKAVSKIKTDIVVEPYSSQEALALIIDNNFSVST